MDENSLEFDMVGIDAAIANAFRRILLAEVFIGGNGGKCGAVGKPCHHLTYRIVSSAIFPAVSLSLPPAVCKLFITPFSGKRSLISLWQEVGSRWGGSGVFVDE